MSTENKFNLTIDVPKRGNGLRNDIIQPVNNCPLPPKCNFFPVDFSFFYFDLKLLHFPLFKEKNEKKSI
jgi:hypothetical protein